MEAGAGRIAEGGGGTHLAPIQLLRGSLPFFRRALITNDVIRAGEHGGS
ncbi:MAG: hypothetical protein QM639_05080 [Rhodocyclaceae bacterium]